ncbi:RNA polymerase sigma factor [Thermophagus xiamenensis]|uniref:RNA polymerase sigma factor, sigma-70 family n=1 Tax=Thermophagus xiamenensis TaxID=385682 RepID=A0A1I1WC13_9BACT|nr:sigma-70 family RNA polymerase sigma factor [Thermophagus xiamenensis]SFD92529.1 RNA polymerase sigma factor, sigma-70 family [Thermophagus xiamenensis]
MADDKKLWMKFKQGNNSALSTIYNQHADFLYHFGLKFTSDEAIVLDAIHDLFLTLIKSRENLGNTDNIRLYLLKAFRRQILKMLKGAGRYSSIDTANSSSDEISFSIEEEILERETIEARNESLYKAVRSLKSRQQEILYYKFTCGLKYEEICEIMDVPYDTARQLVSRAIQILRKKL